MPLAHRIKKKITLVSGEQEYFLMCIVTGITKFSLAYVVGRPVTSNKHNEILWTRGDSTESLRELITLEQEKEAVQSALNKAEKAQSQGYD
jgi:hypothetical protein